jgi:hypothetical protein
MDEMKRLRRTWATRQWDALFLVVLLLAGGTVLALVSGSAPLQQSASAAGTVPRVGIWRAQEQKVEEQENGTGRNRLSPERREVNRC